MSFNTSFCRTHGQALSRMLWLLGTVCWPVCGCAGDPIGVNEALRSVKSNWPDAQFSADIADLTDKSAVVGKSLQVEFEAARPGIFTYIRVTSHGDITLSQQLPATSRGASSLPIHAPLGPEVALFLFTDRPLDGLPVSGVDRAQLGSDRAHAELLARSLGDLQKRGTLLAVRRYEFLVEAPAGQTQYSTRSIIREVQASRGVGSPRFPARIEFDFDSDRLTEAGLRDLDVFGAALVSSLRGRPVRLEGHTDSIGSVEYNIGLSARRARAARQYLVDSFGLPEQQLTALGLGQENPVAPNETAAGRELNRRVDFVFIGSAVVQRQTPLDAASQR